FGEDFAKTLSIHSLRYSAPLYTGVSTLTNGRLSALISINPGSWVDDSTQALMSTILGCSGLCGSAREARFCDFSFRWRPPRTSTAWIYDFTEPQLDNQ